MIAILQPIVPHYREDFFNGIDKKNKIDIYCYDEKVGLTEENFKQGSVRTKRIGVLKIGPVLIYNPITFIRKKYKTIILMLHFGHLTTWFLLLTKPIHKKKIVLWGHGISVKRYLKEEKQPNILLRWMIGLADVIWVYTKKEKAQWLKLFPNKRIIGLNNTISDVGRIVRLKPKETKKNLKEIYKIKEKICFIFCARFNSPYRRVDLLLDIIQKLDTEKYGFIIIGEGDFKPDFSMYNNVYDYGTVYDSDIKDDLFTIADCYLQPGWLGLSVVEALAYGKPIITFKRSEDILQCVEYSYIDHRYNGLILEDVNDFLNIVNSIKQTELVEMGKRAKEYVQNDLLMESMVSNASNSLS